MVYAGIVFGSEEISFGVFRSGPRFESKSEGLLKLLLLLLTYDKICFLDQKGRGFLN